MRPSEKDDIVVEYDSYKKILYYPDINTYKWSKSVFKGAEARNAIGDQPLDGLNFSFYDDKQHIVLKGSEKDEAKILYFLKENYLKVKKVTLKTGSEISEKTSLITKLIQAKRLRDQEQQDSISPLKKRSCPQSNNCDNAKSSVKDRQKSPRF